MKDIYLQIYIPSENKTFDIKASRSLLMYQLSSMIFDVLSSEVDVELLEKSNSTLCDKQRGIIFNINMSIAELGLRNGSQLMLI